MFLRKSFEDFLSNEVNLDDTRMARVKRAHRTVRRKLRAMEEVRKVLTGMYLQGSYALLTATRPCGAHVEYDVDIVLAADFRNEDEYKLSGRQALLWLQRQIESIGLYQGKTKILKHCVRIEYESDGQRFHLDVVLAHRPDSTDGPIEIPPQWALSNPKGYIEWFDKQSRRSDRLRHVVRLLKYWRNLQGGGPNSMVLTTLATQHAPASHRSLDDALVKTMSSTNKWLQGQSPHDIEVLNPSLKEENLARNWQAADVASFQSRFKTATQLAEEALSCKDEEETIKIWNAPELFDGTFPKTVRGLDKAPKSIAAAMSGNGAVTDPSGKVGTTPSEDHYPVKKSGGFYGDS